MRIHDYTLSFRSRCSACPNDRRRLLSITMRHTKVWLCLPCARRIGKAAEARKVP